MGRLLALSLARAGHKITLFEAQGADAQGAAAHVAAAMLAPLAESAITQNNVVRMGHYALSRWPELIATLTQPVYFQQNGTLVLWHQQDSAEAERFKQQLERTHRNLPQLAPLQTLDTQGLQHFEPSVSTRFAKGLYLPNEGQLDNRQLLQALLHELEQHQVQIHWHTPKSLTDFAPGTPGQPDWLLDCRGLGAKNQWPAVRGVRGEVVRLYAPDVVLQRPTRLVHPRYPIYIAPKQDHIFMVGATEIETEDVSPASVRSTLELLSAAYTVHPGFGEARILEILTQCRPTLPDNLPAIRKLGARTLQINGLYRHGFMIAPALLDTALELISSGSSALAQKLDIAIETPA